MAGESLVLDASVGVKWFSAAGEDHVGQARALLKAHSEGQVTLLVPDIFFHEVSNALVHKKGLPTGTIEEAISSLFALGLVVTAVSEDLLLKSVQIARKADVTEYDACYAAAAIKNRCALVTANPRHQNSDLGCRVIGIGEWKER
jgi:predicted nucleic acid-binding protein